MLFLILAVLHLVCCLLVFFGIRLGILKVHKSMFFVSLLLPFWGLLLVLILHFQIAFDADDSIDVGVEKMKLESELYKSVTVDDKKVADSTVPIEEALLINSAGERRSIIMDVLNDNPKEYVEFLQKAGNNDDTEVVHYAVTAMVEISKENDYRLQELERKYSLYPDDNDVLCEYTEFWWSCLSQNLMQGQVEVLNRELFSTLMNKKLEHSSDINDYSRLIKNELKRKNYFEAERALDEMAYSWRDTEEYILLKLEYLASVGDGAQIRKLIEEVENNKTYISAKEALAFWKK